MKLKNNKKFLLIGLVIMSILLCVSTINATNTDQQTSTDITNTQQTTGELQKDNSVKEVKEKISINKYKDDKIIKKDSTVNNYTQLYNKIEEIKTNSTNNEEIITLNPGNYNITETINWGNTTHTTKTLTIKANNITIDGGNQKQFITITNGYTLNLENIVIQNCNSTNGSVIYNNGNVTINNSNFNNNTATNNGGINVNNGNSTLTINNSNFNNNTAKYGGITYTYRNTTITINNSNFINNIAEMGGINYNNGNLIIANSNHTSNNAKINMEI